MQLSLPSRCFGYFCSSVIKSKTFRYRYQFSSYVNVSQ